MKRQFAAVPAAALALALTGAGGCTWVKLTEGGASVAQASAEDVGDCQLVGNVTSSTQDRVLLKRGAGKVSEELIVMARNEAVTLGGDTLVPAGPVEDGRQDFRVYRCG